MPSRMFSGSTVDTLPLKRNFSEQRSHPSNFEIFSQRLLRTIQIYSRSALVVALAFAVLAPTLGRLLDRLYFINGVVLVGLLAPILLAAWRARVRHFGLFVAAWSAPILVTAARTLHGL